MREVNEEAEVRRLTSRADQKAEEYFKRYRKQIESLESDSVLKEVNGAISSHDIAALGQQLESWDDYVAMCEETGSVSNLGTIPNIAHDVITVAYGTSPISTIASVQPIEEEHGMVYFKEVSTVKARGNVAAGAVIARSDGVPDEYPGTEGDGPFAGDRIVGGTATTTASDQSYTINVPVHSHPLRPFKTTVIANLDGQASTVADVWTWRDIDGDGTMMSAQGGTATINYATGVITVNFPAGTITVAGDTITAWVSTDFEGQDDIPTINMKLVSKAVRARVFALRNTVGLAQAYAMKKRFGMQAEEDLATDLVAEINTEIMHALIATLKANAKSSTTWGRTPGDGISFLEHKQTFKDALATAESQMLKNAGRGMISTMISGRKACEVIGTLPGFNKISNGSTIGTHIYGTLNGVTVVRTPHNQVLEDNTVLCVYKGATPFEAAAVYSPYMPLVVTDTLPTGVNPLVNQKAAAVWAAIESLVPNFATTLKVDPTGNKGAIVTAD